MAGALLLDALRSGGGDLIPIDSEHNAIFQCLPHGRANLSEAGARRHVDRVGGPFRGKRRRPRASLPTGLCPPEMAHGQENLGRLGHIDEQGSGGHRGALAVRCRSRSDRGRRASGKHRAFPGRISGWIGAGAARQSRHANGAGTGVGVAGAHRFGCPRARPPATAPVNFKRRIARLSAASTWLSGAGERRHSSDHLNAANELPSMRFLPVPCLSWPSTKSRGYPGGPACFSGE